MLFYKMSAPTLFIPGNLEATDYSEPQQELNKHQPLDYIMKWIERKLNKMPESKLDRILILQSSTGSGKSTTIPPELFHRFFAKFNKSIACTQPRVLTAKEIPNTILEFHSKEYFSKHNISKTPLKLGVNLGFITGSLAIRPGKGVVFMTIGVLLQQFSNSTDEELMNKYFVIIIDEAHERSVDADMVLFYIKQFLQRCALNSACPMFIIMSATIDTIKFCDYMLDEPDRYKNIIKVKGFSYPIQDIFATTNVLDYINFDLELIKQIHRENPNDYKQRPYYGDILVFMPGVTDMNKLKDNIESILTDKLFQDNPIVVLSISSEAVQEQNDDYKKAFMLDIDQIMVGKKKCTRRIIMATNVAETGITINSLGYVIDNGYYKSAEFNPNLGAKILIKKPITQSMHKQRRGRVGRKSPGKSYMAYTKDAVDHMLIDQYPEIIKSDSTRVILNMLIKMTDINNQVVQNLHRYVNNLDQRKSPNLFAIDLPDNPNADAMNYSLDMLYQLGCIDRSCLPTSLGIIMNKINRISLGAAKMILSAYVYEVSVVDMISLAALCSFDITDLIGKRKSYTNARDNGHFSFRFPGFTDEYNAAKTDMIIVDDFIRMLLVYCEFVNHMRDPKLKEWCYETGIEYRTMLEVIQLREDILYNLASIGFDPYKKFDTEFKDIMNINADIFDKRAYIRKLKLCIFEGFKTNIAEYHNGQYYYGRLPLDISSEFVVNELQIKKYNCKPCKFIFSELVIALELGVYTRRPTNICVLDGYIC
jgi:HrpA-like RNA helicase